ncbi:MAG: preprotein translocase subunit SecG [Verrucomicrobiota bacterium]
MTFIITALTIILVFVCLLMILVVLMQRPKQEGLGAAFGGGVTDQMFGSQTTNVLQKATVWLAVMFFILTLAISLLMAGNNKQVPNIVGAAAITAPAGEGENPGGAALGAGTPADGPIAIKADGSSTPVNPAGENAEGTSATPDGTAEPQGDAPVTPAEPAAEPAETPAADPSN